LIHERTDLDIVASVLEGRTADFRLLVTRYQDIIFRLSTFHLGNRDDAADATQEVFLRAFRFLPKFRTDAKFLPWLYTIATNYLKTSGARRTRRLKQETPFDLETLPATRGIDPQKSLILREDAAAVRAEVLRLPPRLRDAAVLYYLEEMSVEETGDLLGLSSENVKSRLFRARKRLRDSLLRPD